MIYSMTAFARLQHQGDWGSLVCEMRSINHRYLEISLHLPELLREFEMPIRESIRKQHIKRGKIECTIRYQLNPAMAGAFFRINEVLVQELTQASQQIANYIENPAPIAPSDILRFPGVMESTDADLSSLQAQLIELVENTTKELAKVRAREGEELKKTFLIRLDSMEGELNKVRERLPSIVQDQRDRLLKRFTEAKVELDPNRLEQEMVLYAQKIDVAEEVDRTATHITEMRRVLDQGGSVGRRLDFLLQELNREANTMGSKSTDTVMTHAAVDIKVLIEQIREQVQNVE